MRISCINGVYEPSENHGYNIEASSEDEKSWVEIISKYNDLQIFLKKEYEKSRKKIYERLEKS